MTKKTSRSKTVIWHFKNGAKMVFTGKPPADEVYRGSRWDYLECIEEVEPFSEKEWKELFERYKKAH
jgi:hypothetical protein